MLDKKNIEKFANLNNIPTTSTRRLLTEYLQSEILQILYSSKYGNRLTFLGGTCLRFVYGIERFSENLDFDLIPKKDINIDDLADFFENELEKKGFIIDIIAKETQNVFVIVVKFIGVMKEMGISGCDNQKLKIKFEIDPKSLKNITYDSKLITTFGKSFNVIANSAETLFAQKVLAIVFHPYQKGRDFYDLVWFLSQKNIEPNYKIFEEKDIPISNRKELVEFLLEQAEKTDLKQAAKDVERFLFYPEQAQWIEDLSEYLKSWKLRIKN